MGAVPEVSVVDEASVTIGDTSAKVTADVAKEATAKLGTFYIKMSQNRTL
jgi:hypothetical protein